MAQEVEDKGKQCSIKEVDWISQAHHGLCDQHTKSCEKVAQNRPKCRMYYSEVFDCRNPS